MAPVPSSGHAISPPLAVLIFLHLAITPLHARPQWRIPEGSRSSSPVAIRRLNGGDAFRGADEQHGSCSEELCKAAGGTREGSSGDPSLRGFWGHCTCRCAKKTPAFREDLHKCTDNVNECSLASFVSSMGDDSKSMAVQKIPLVFLPLKGQILHPSASLKIDAIHGVRSSTGKQMVGHASATCTVTASYFLTRNGWVHLSNITTDMIGDHEASMGINRRGQQGSLLYRETNTPFRIHEEKGQIYLKWLGELNMREILSGRMVLVHLGCHKQGSIEIIQQCIGFRVAGTISITQGIREVTFEGQEVTGPGFGAGIGVNSNIRTENNVESASLTTSEWVAIAAASLFLGAIYVSTVFLYLHLKNSRRSNDEGKRGKQRRIMCGRMWRTDSSDLEECNESASPEGIIKTNPLLLLHECHQHHKKQGHYRQGSGNSSCINMDGNRHGDESTDEDNHLSSKTSSASNILKTVIQMDGLSSDEDSSNKVIDKRDFHRSHRHHQITAAMVHSSSAPSSSIERLPEEDVSIVEAPQPLYRSPSVQHELGLNIRSEPPDSLPPDITSDDPFVPSLFSSSPEALLAAMMGINSSCAADSYGHNRKKLYFNPAYFEPELLQSPPPAALEFLSKIREVITLARHRMAAKRFSPSLLGIPEVEEEDNHSNSENNEDVPDNQIEPIPPCLKRENSRHTSKSKENVIQKWLDNIKSTSKEDSLPIKVHPNSVKSPPTVKKKPKAPLAPPAPAAKEPSVAEDTKQAMKAVIRELEVRRNVGVACKWDAKNENGVYEVDSLEKTKKPTIGDTLEVVMLNDADCEVVSVEEESSTVKLYRLPELLSRADGYSLVSEVYVNDTYNTIGRVGTDQIEMKIAESGVTSVINECDKKNGELDNEDKSSTSSETRKKEVKELEEAVEETDVKEVLTIRLEDSPSTHRRNLIPEDNFEMDTLDRKSKEESVEEESVGSTSALSEDYNYEDSLERPLRRIFLRSSGSFRSDSVGRTGNAKNYKNYTKTSSSATDLASILGSSPLTRTYGSLREVYEARQRRRREQRRRRSSDAAMRAGYGPVKHSNLSAIPAWRMARGLPKDEPNYYPPRTDNYSPVSGRTRESPLHHLLSTQSTARENDQKSLYEESSLRKKQMEPVTKSPKLQAPDIPNLNQSHYSSPTAKHIKIDPPSPTHFEYFKQDGLYTSPFCDDDDEDDSEEIDEEDPKESKMSIDSLTINNSFQPDITTSPSENISMMALLQHLQNQKRTVQNNGLYSVVNPKERKITNVTPSKVARVSQELQRELLRSQQMNGNPSKKSGSSFGRADNMEGAKPVKRTWRRLIEKREKERVAEEESSGEARVRGAERLENQLRRIAAVDRCILSRLNQRKDPKFRLEDSGYLSSSDESAIGRMSIRKGRNSSVAEAEVDDADGMTKSEGDGCSDTEGESVFDGASESGAESIATDSFFGSFRVFTTAAEKAEQQQKQRQRCSSLFGIISENEGNFASRSKMRVASEEDATDSESGGFVKVIRNTQKGPFLKANS